jgi:hypothetical protein
MTSSLSANLQKRERRSRDTSMRGTQTSANSATTGIVAPLGASAHWPCHPARALISLTRSREAPFVVPGH